MAKKESTDNQAAYARTLALLDEAVDVAPGNRLKRALMDARRAVHPSVREDPKAHADYVETRRKVSGRTDSMPPSPDLTALNPSSERE